MSNPSDPPKSSRPSDWECFHRALMQQIGADLLPSWERWHQDLMRQMGADVPQEIVIPAYDAATTRLKELTQRISGRSDNPPFTLLFFLAEKCHWDLGKLAGLDVSQVIGFVEQALKQKEQAKKEDETQRPAVDPKEERFWELLRVATHERSTREIRRVWDIIQNGRLTVQEKLTKIDRLIPPLFAQISARDIAKVLGVSRQAVTQTDWWRQTRKGERKREREAEVSQRLDIHQQRAGQYEPPPK